MNNAVILLSGGLDSTTCLAIAKAQGFNCYTLSFDYGQRHHYELKAAAKIAEDMRVIDHRVITLDISQFGHSALTDHKIAVPDFKKTETIPITYVPARNTIFLANALGYAETIEAFDIFIGANAVDYSGYPDCRPEFITSFQKLANLATKAGIEQQRYIIQAPLLHLKKADIIQLGHQLGVNYRLTVSCYQLTAEGAACGRCDSCVLRAQGFISAKIADPTQYR
ncbi:MAG: 7-cyano-7-deazaguanine synthase QueC [Legionella sp.]